MRRRLLTFRRQAAHLAKELTRLCQEKGLQPEWQPLLNDLDRLQETTIKKDGKVITTRTHVSGQVENVFRATGIALRANISERRLLAVRGLR